MRIRARRGFTLVEVLIVLAIIGIIATIAVPSYQESMRKGRRADAMTSLAAIQIAQEKWRANNTTYGTLTNLGYGSDPSDSTDKYYSLTVTSNTATAFVATATPKSGGAQVGDSCGTFAVNQNGPITNNSSYANSACWGK